MDVPISIGIVLALAMSVAETIHHAEHAYFDAALMLLAFLLAGRYLDQSMRRKTRAVAGNLAALKGETATKFVGADEISVVPIAAVQAGDIVLLRPGERSAVDGSVIEGQSKIDQSLITGETLPVKAGPGTAVYAGTLNLSGALRVRVSAASEGTLLAEISRLLDNAVQARSRYVQLADRASRLYAPVVHAAALLTMLGWAAYGATWHDAIVTAISVLIITCPCALGLAIPAVQTVVVGRHVPDRRAAQFRRCHRAAGRSRSRRVRQDGHADLAGARRHECRRCSERRVRTRRPARTWPAIIPSPPRWRGPPEQRRRWPGSRRSQARACVASSTGSKSGWAGRRFAARTRSPTRSCAGIPRLPSSPSAMAKRSMSSRFGSACAPMRQGAIATLIKAGIEVEILSGDREPAVRHAAETLGIHEWRAGVTPADKIARIEELKRRGVKVLMVGDGMNDAPALAAAHVSMSPVSATHLSQATADLVFLGDRLAPVVTAIGFSRKALRLMRQNLWLAAGYNLLAVPLAIAGLATPLVAAAAMSGSSLLVILNALRAHRGAREFG